MSRHASDSRACLVVRASPSNDAWTIASATDHPEDLPEPDLVRAAGLTSAELELLPLLMRYLSLTEIADRVGLPRSTIEMQARSIYRKLGVSPTDVTARPI
jgi:DNA-binding NarL/FixJ family response regulator